MRALALLLVAFGFVRPALGAEADPAVVFAWEAPVEADATGLTRLRLPEDVLSRCAPDLSDLRLYRADGAEVPFAVEEAPAQTAARVEHPELLSLERAREPDHDRWYPWVYLERFSVSAPVDGAEHRWELRLDSGLGRFVREVEVRAGSPDGPLLASSSIFRLADGRERLTLALPTLAEGPLFIQLRGADGGYLEPKVTLSSRWPLGAPERVVFPLATVEEESADGRTELVVERPGAVVPATVRITTSTPSFDRPVVVWDEGRGRRSGRVGGGRIWRLDAEHGVQSLGVDLAGTVGERLRIEVSDGDSPPLAEPRVEAVLVQPTLVFDARGTEGLVLRFGSERVRRPDYDIATLLGAGRWLQGEADAPTLFDPRALGEASLGAVVGSSSHTREPALAFASRPGRALELAGWSHLRSLDVPTTADHLVRVRLTPADLARARADLADLRIVDGEGRQWPYLRATEERAVPVPLASGPVETSQAGVTHYPLRAPEGPLRMQALELQGPTGYLDRAFTLFDADGNRVAGGRLVRQADDPRPVTIDLREVRTERLRLEIVDGDDAPLDWTGFVARVPTTDLLATLDPGTYRLLVGNPESEAATYELGRVASTVRAVRAEPVQPGPLLPNPAWAPPAVESKGLERGALWVVLIAAVVLLGGITLRSASGTAE